MTPGLQGRRTPPIETTSLQPPPPSESLFNVFRNAIAELSNFGSRLEQCFCSCCCDYTVDFDRISSDPVSSSVVRKLAHESIRQAVFLGPKEEIPMAIKADADRMTHFCENQVRIREWEKTFLPYASNVIRLGGKVSFVPGLGEEGRDAVQIGILASDEIYPICAQGCVRSQILRLVLLEVKRKLGCEAGEEGIGLAHGAWGGYDSETKIPKLSSQGHPEHLREPFEVAFGEMRPLRYGEEAFIGGFSPRLLFDVHYWRNTGQRRTRKIYITFGEAALAAFKRLAALHQGMSDKPLQNVHVICIPDPDWISHLSTSEWQNAIAIKDPEWMRDLPPYYRGMIDKITAQNPDISLQTKLYREAFRDYATLFLPIKTSSSDEPAPLPSLGRID